MNSNDRTLGHTVSVTEASSRYNSVCEEKMSAIEALKYIDDHWYKEIGGKKARWMDLIGDYAGNERFVLDGNEHWFVVEDSH